MALRGFRLLINPTNLRKISRFFTIAQPLEKHLGPGKMTQAGGHSSQKGHYPPEPPGGNHTNALSQFSWITDLVPVFGVNGSQIRIIKEPDDFFQTLKVQARCAKKRIVLASLYLGTGKLEHELVNSIRDAAADARSRNEQLEVSVLLDYTRGSRGAHNSRTMLLPLMREFGDSVHVSLYHTPELRGVTKTLLPERWNEIIGLSHLKIYLFDDNVIMSGANLSESYFTNRQDRYILLENCPHVTSFFSRLVSTVSSLSFQLSRDDTVSLSPTMPHHPYQDGDRGEAFKREAKKRIEEVIDPNTYARDTSHCTQTDGDCAHANKTAPGDHVAQSAAPSDGSSASDIDTWVCPMVQMGVFNVTVDDLVTESLFRRAAKGSVINLASGYFNLTRHYMDTIVQKSQADFNILSAAPEANGFYGARGVSGAVPDAYTYIARQFHFAVKDAHQDHRISLHEYTRPGWTFHAKGLWYRLPGQTHPSLTFIGSPNFGYRSVFRDLEAQLVVITDNNKLKSELYTEQSSLYSLSAPVSDETFEKPERRIPTWVTYLTPIIKNFF